MADSLPTQGQPNGVSVELTYDEALRLSYVMRFTPTERSDDLRIANAVDEAIKKAEHEWEPPPDPTHTQPDHQGPPIEVVGTDESGDFAYIWLKDSDAPLPDEADARAAVVATALRDWDWHLDAPAVEPLDAKWFKQGDGEEELIPCEPDDPNRLDRFWVWDISLAHDA